MDGHQSKDTIKCVLVGDGVGKTCLLMRFKDKTFNSNFYVPTVFDHHDLDYTYEYTDYILSLWDTSGAEDYDRLRPKGYPHTDIFLLCYSCDGVNGCSFENVKHKWIPEIKDHCPDTPIVLVGTKLDLREGKKSAYDTNRIRESFPQIVGHTECSAKTGDGVEEVFKMAVQLALASKRKSGEASKSKKKKLCCQIL